MELERRHILPAVACAAVLHGAVAIAVFWQPITAGAIGAGVDGLEVSLGAAGGAFRAASPIAPDEVAPDEVTETAETQEVAEAAPAEPADAPPETAEAAQPVAPSAAPEPEVVEPDAIEVVAVDPVEIVPETEVTEVAEPETDTFAAPVPRARPRDLAPTKPERKRTTAKHKEPKRTATPQPARAEPQQKQVEPEREQPVRQVRATGGDAAAEVADTRGQGTSGAAGDANNAGNSTQASAGGNPGAHRDYVTRLAALLARHKRYPRRAQSRGQEGVGHLYFVVEASGNVRTVRLQKSTGHRLLDKEILALLDRVGRLPPIPDDIGVAQLELVVPVNFDLR